MIEWDEINWRSVIGIIVFAILLIAGSIFALNDFLNSKRLKADMEADLSRINEFYSTWKPPSQKDLEQMSSKADSLQKQLDQLKPRIGSELDFKQVQEKIQQLAGSAGVSLERMDAQTEGADGFLKVYPLTLAVKGSNEQISRFLIGVDNLGVAYRRRGNPAITSGQIELNLEFLAFDQQGWDKAYSCSIQANPPELKEANISRVKIFKDDLDGLKEKINAEKIKLEQSKKLLAEQCELEKKISGLERQINLSKSLAK